MKNLKNYEKPQFCFVDILTDGTQCQTLGQSKQIDMNDKKDPVTDDGEEWGGAPPFRPGIWDEE